MSAKLVFMVGCVALAASAAIADPVPSWTAVPSKADMAAAYPAKAKAANIGGGVNLSCAINRLGHIRECGVLGESPKGFGFGNAARKIAEQLQAPNGSTPSADVRVAVTFTPDMLKSEPLTITQPVWSALPSPADFQASFPKTANGVNDVRVALACTIQADGGLGDCAVASEAPTGEGYGQGALALAWKFKVGPWSKDGQPTAGARIRVPIHYLLTPVPPKA
jgi:TonB family protein